MKFQPWQLELRLQFNRPSRLPVECAGVSSLMSSSCQQFATAQSCLEKSNLQKGSLTPNHTRSLTSATKIMLTWNDPAGKPVFWDKPVQSQNLPKGSGDWCHQQSESIHYLQFACSMVLGRLSPGRRGWHQKHPRAAALGPPQHLYTFSSQVFVAVS